MIRRGVAHFRRDWPSGHVCIHQRIVLSVLAYCDEIVIDCINFCSVLLYCLAKGKIVSKLTFGSAKGFITSSS